MMKVFPSLLKKLKSVLGLVSQKYKMLSHDHLFLFQLDDSNSVNKMALQVSTDQSL